MANRVVAEVVAELDEEDVGGVEAGLLAVLVEQEAGLALDVGVGDGRGRDAPRAADGRAVADGQPPEVELAAHRRVRTARVRHVVAVERHHVAHHVRQAVSVCWFRRTTSRESTTSSDLNHPPLSLSASSFVLDVREQKDSCFQKGRNYLSLVFELAFHRERNGNREWKRKGRTPVLAPAELEVAFLSEGLFDGVVDALDDHVLEAGALQQVRHRRRHAERVDGPAVLRCHAHLHRQSPSNRIVPNTRWLSKG